MNATARAPVVWRFFFRLALSLALLYFALGQVDLASAADKFGSFTPTALLAALLSQFASNTAASARWQAVMMSARGPRQSTAFYFRSLFCACFVNQCLPTIIGGDTLRVVDLAGRGVPPRDALGGVFIDRVVGFSGLVLLTLIMLPVAGGLFPPAMSWTVAFLSIAALAAVGIGVWLPLERWQARLRLPDGLIESAAFARRVLFDFRSLALQSVLTLMVHILSALAFFFLARDLGVQIPLSGFLLILPSVFFLAAVPLSISGWGIRETSVVALFAFVGADRSAILAVSVCFGVISFIATLPGLWFLLRGRRGDASKHG